MIPLITRHFIDGYLAMGGIHCINIMYDKFKNSIQFRSKCIDTGTKCPVCGNSVIEIERKKLNERVTSLFGYFALVVITICLAFLSGLLKIKPNNMKLNLGCLIALGIFLGLCVWFFIIAVENTSYEF